MQTSGHKLGERCNDEVEDFKHLLLSSRDMEGERKTD